jgi:repressor LexA
MKTLTKAQKRVLDCIRRLLEETDGQSPSYEEIAACAGIATPSTVCVHVKNLESKGFLKTKFKSGRSIEILERQRRDPESVVQIPLVGRIAAGKPFEAVAVHESIALPASMVGKNETYVLKVEGDSMIDDHVMDGDLVIVEKRTSPREGETVVALVRNTDVTLKRYRRQGRKIRLDPANPAYQPLLLDEDEVEIQGVVVGLLRKF